MIRHRHIHSSQEEAEKQRNLIRFLFAITDYYSLGGHFLIQKDGLLSFLNNVIGLVSQHALVGAAETDILLINH